MCEMLPTNKQELKQVHGLGKTRIEKYGENILKVIKSYCDKNQIDTAKKETLFKKQKQKKNIGETKLISLKLFKSKKSIEEIAKERELTTNTIFGHLASFIASGEVNILDLISEKHYKELIKIIPKHKFENLSDLKHQIDNKYTFGELRLVLQELSSK